MPRKTIDVDFLEWHRIVDAVDQMQDAVFFCQDDEGLLRRWVPPRPVKRAGRSDG